MAETRGYRVTGKVQGVSYRASTRRRAEELELSGWVRNCPDGSVELQATGSAQALQQLEDWLWQGPKHARVKAVTSGPVSFEAFPGFEVRD
ncbi:acylphosphatase [Chromatocurvus halotolerans]|uniref:acylphosphatase n=1 Tax=Chromatocurvus halotolerans TaxID=1132028 RepID=A0A4R2KWV6_9GAMM|nr:acylphosphatase [Chromatocurvus halotolerans]TCO78474.1 acylphosphatase [Chromatocurvus halotolerans]